ncbi:MAG TPA: ATP-binding protein, partial [Archangium sp.]
ALFFVFTLLAWAFARRGRMGPATWLYVTGAALSSMFAMVLNGGLLAPGGLRTVAAVVLIGWLVGRRGVTWSAIAATVMVFVVMVLTIYDLLPEPPTAAPLQRAMSTAFAIWLVWAGTAVPQRRLRQALNDSFQREQDLLAAEAKRRRSELAFEAVFEQAGQLMLLLDRGGALLRANKAALETFGKGLVPGRSFLEAVAWPDEGRERLRAALQSLGTTPVQLEVRDAKGCAFDLTLSAIDDQERRVVVQGRDISELLAQKEREARSSRLALVGQLAGGVAHDFNNVLAVTLSSVEATREELAQAGQLKAPVIEYLDEISDVTQRAADLTRRLLSFGRKAPLVRKVRSLHQLVRATMTLLSRTLPANIALRDELQAKDDLIEVDAASLESVLLNLAINARDAMPHGGSITLGSEVVELDEADCKAIGFELKPGTFVLLSVSDTGTGIAPEVIGRVFEPFFTTKSEGKGSGIGLASVLGAMQEHRGAVGVESTLGRGTRFSLYFPLAYAAVSATPVPVAATELTGMTALVVDDEPQLRALLARQLTRFGVTPIVASNAEAGLEAFKQTPDKFDFAVLDVVLPGRSGSELAKDLLAMSAVKVLLVSGFPRDADLGALPSDRVALLGKPFSGQALKAALTQLLVKPS